MFQVRGFYVPDLRPKGDWIVFGAAEVGLKMMEQLETEGSRVIAFCDNDPAKQGCTLTGRPVHSADFLRAHTNTPIAVAAGRFQMITRQIRELGCLRVWVPIIEPGFAAEFSEAPSFSFEEMRVLLILPQHVLKPNQLERVLTYFYYRFGKCHQTGLAAYPDTFEAYVEMKPGMNIAPFDVALALEDFDALVFARSWDMRVEQFWNPDPFGIVERRVYCLQPWGYIKCTNRPLSNFDFRHSNTHAFYRASAADPNSDNIMFPYGVINRIDSNAEIDIYGHRITVNWRGLEHRKSSEFVIQIYGGSAAWGCGCIQGETLAERLEYHLNARRQDGFPSFTVLNLAVPGTTIFSEIVDFLLFGQRLKPEIVIAHDGYNDFFYGQQVEPSILMDLDLIYLPAFENWAGAAHGNPGFRESHRRAPPEALVSAYTRRRDQFASIMKATGTQFISGLQPHIGSKPELSEDERDYLNSAASQQQEQVNMEMLYQMAVKRSTQLSYPFLNFHALFEPYGNEHNLLHDTVHLTPEGNDLVARIYCDFICERILPKLLAKRDCTSTGVNHGDPS
jgi:hypothetical protein